MHDHINRSIVTNIWVDGIPMGFISCFGTRVEVLNLIDEATLEGRQFVDLPAFSRTDGETILSTNIERISMVGDEQSASSEEEIAAENAALDTMDDEGGAILLGGGADDGADVTNDSEPADDEKAQAPGPIDPDEEPPTLEG